MGKWHPNDPTSYHQPGEVGGLRGDSWGSYQHFHGPLKDPPLGSPGSVRWHFNAFKHAKGRYSQPNMGHFNSFSFIFMDIDGLPAD